MIRPGRAFYIVIQAFQVPHSASDMLIVLWVILSHLCFKLQYHALLLFYSKEKCSSSMELHEIASVILYIIFPIGFIGNAAVLYVLSCRKSKQTVWSIYLFNLALADIIFLITIPFWGFTFGHDYNWIFGPEMCKVIAVVTNFNMFASVFFITAMSLDRWIAVEHSIRARRFRNLCMAKWISFAVWCLALICAVPRAIFQRQYIDLHHADNVTRTSNVAGSNFNVEETSTVSSSLNQSSNFASTGNDSEEENTLQCSFFIPTKYFGIYFWHGFYYTANTVLAFVIPMIVICVCYVRIVLHLRNSPSRNLRKQKIFRFLCLVILAFFICWLPAQILSLYEVFIKSWIIKPIDNKTADTARLFAQCVAWTNSCINPILYGFTGKAFQQSLRKAKQNPCFALKDLRKKCSFRVRTRSCLGEKRKSNNYFQQDRVLEL